MTQEEIIKQAATDLEIADNWNQIYFNPNKLASWYSDHKFKLYGNDQSVLLTLDLVTGELSLSDAVHPTEIAKTLLDAFEHLSKCQ